MPAQSKGTLVVFGGFDSYIEEWLPAGLFFRDAGYDTILFEGPGQGAALELTHLPMSPEWEKPVKTVLDFFRRDAVTLMGFSLGGGLVIHAAAFEPRVRRVIRFFSVDTAPFLNFTRIANSLSTIDAFARASR
jgi:alpha-beta hydrolase superfamily lysophospholipase